MATITFQIPDALDQELARQSTATHVSKGDLALEAIQRYLQVGNFRALQSKFAPLSQARGIHTDDDVFGTLREP
jgi:predicted transcriptional regulator